MSTYTKLLKFDKETALRIAERDGVCMFCKQNYHMDCKSQMLYEIQDIMHYIPKSDLGLGIEQNGVLGCRYHHGLLDNGNKGLREEMRARMREHLKAHYPGWEEETLRYRKYGFLVHAGNR